MRDRSEKKPPTTIELHAYNAQTIVDVLHNALFHTMDRGAALANSQSTRHIAEIATYCGAKKIRLTRGFAKTTYGLTTTLSDALTESRLPKEQQEAFSKQDKVKQLNALLGVNLMDPYENVPHIFFLNCTLTY